MTVINPLKNWIFLLQYGFTFSASRLRLKGNICIPREQFPRLSDDITSKSEPARPARRPRVWPPVFSIIHFSPYLLIIRQFNKCGVSTLMFDHTSEQADLGSVRRTAPRLPLLFLPPASLYSAVSFPSRWAHFHNHAFGSLQALRFCTKGAQNKDHFQKQLFCLIKKSFFF